MNMKIKKEYKLKSATEKIKGEEEKKWEEQR